MNTAQQRREQVRAAERAARAAADFNAAHPVGTRVIAYPGTRQGRLLDTRTRTRAWVVGEDACVSVEGYAGGIALTHVDVIDTAPPVDIDARVAEARAFYVRGRAETFPLEPPYSGELAEYAADFDDLVGHRPDPPSAETDDHEWTDAELDAAYAAFHAHSGSGSFNEYNEYVCAECGYALSWPDRPTDGGRRAKRHAAREALAAARAVRQEKR